MRKRINKSQWMILGMTIFFGIHFQVEAIESKDKDLPSGLNFETAIYLAQQNDPWITGNLHQQQAIESRSKLVGTLPDPKVSLDMANLPVNSFDLGQEAMTQLKVGVSQTFSRGNTLTLKTRQLAIQSEAYPFLREDRAAKVAVMVGSLWLDIYQIQQSITLIHDNHSLFEQMVDITQASYSAAFGRTNQQDIIRAQLELTRLNERVDKLKQEEYRVKGQLSQWLSDFSDNGSGQLLSSYSNGWTSHNIEISTQIPNIKLRHAELFKAGKVMSPEALMPFFALHPSVMAMDKKINATKTGIDIANQKYKPEWGLNASYGYRADDPTGVSRSDFMSVGLSFDLPIFTENRQDQEVKAAISDTEAVKTDKMLLLRDLLGIYLSDTGRLLSVNQRQHLYTSKLLPQVNDEAEASLTAYTNDDGDFSDVVRSRITVLNAEIDKLSLDVEQQKIRLELNYLFVGEKQQVTINKINNHLVSKKRDGTKGALK
ncbi:TolC family protein [Shewanella surugensis]|uniref:TolC family protein n=1 Tax=Shewanella surugensis TaxID=212020 RepID=A0ABT0L6R0_9GAMM|nr:TolC family protein [Shewanella surugensis]MCL1123350.1 TolC family protein [Shewanella surugensis]